jgi:hypothetical protein
MSDTNKILYITEVPILQGTLLINIRQRSTS